MKRGMILLEILIASLIASIMSTGLLLTIVQLNIAQKKLLDLTSQYERVATVMQQLEHDIMGAFIPLQAMPLAKSAEPKKDQTSSDDKSGSVPSAPTPPAQPKKQPKPIDHIFEGAEKNGQFDSLTFITDNPLAFAGAQNSKPKPRMVRVVYRLEQDVKRKNSFNLKWQEGSNLNFSAYNKDAKNELRPYTIIEGIASMKVQYIMLDPEKNKDEKKEDQAKDGQSSENKKPKKRVYKKVSSWKQKNDDKKKMIQLPEAVEITIELWDSMYERKNQFSMVIPLFGTLTMQLSDEKKTENKKDAKDGKDERSSLPTPQFTQAESSSHSTPQQAPNGVSLPSQNDKIVQNGDNQDKNKFNVTRRNSTTSGTHSIESPYAIAMRNKVKREYRNKNQLHNTQDMSWLERVKVQDGSELIVNGVKYVPTA